MIWGIDFSITSPAICQLAEDDSFINSKFWFLTSVKKRVGVFNNITGSLHKEWSCDMERYQQISDWVMNCIQPSMVDKVYIEGYSLNSKGKIYQIHENTAVLKYRLYTEHLIFDTIPPTVIKKSATKKGNANKELIYSHFLKSNPDIREWLGIEKKEKIGNPIGDIVDSFYTAICGKYHVKK